MKTINCLNCSTPQPLDPDYIYQDILGKYMICYTCQSTFDVEPEEEDTSEGGRSS